MSRPSSSILLEKTPNHGLFGDVILQVFPDARFLHIIRDPRSVASSLRSAAKGWGALWAPASITDACREWKTGMGRARTIGLLTTNYKEVRYEALHSDTVGELERVFAWLNEENEGEHVPEYVAACNIDSLRSGTVKAPWDLNSEPPQFFRRGKVDSWREELTGAEIAVIERLARKEMAELGYEPVAGPRDRALAKARLKAYRLASRAADAVRAGADRLKP